MKVKLTDSKGQTQNQTQWGEGVTHRATGEGTDMCTDNVIHYYESPEIAIFANPIHANYNKDMMLMWEFKPEHKINHDGLKSACKEGTTIRQVPIPSITTEQRVAAAIKIALLTYNDERFVDWAEKWLSGENRSAGAAKAARNAAWADETTAWATAAMAAKAAMAAAKNKGAEVTRATAATAAMAAKEAVETAGASGTTFQSKLQTILEEVLYGKKQNKREE